MSVIQIRGWPRTRTVNGGEATPAGVGMVGRMYQPHGSGLGLSIVPTVDSRMGAETCLAFTNPAQETWLRVSMLLPAMESGRATNDDIRMTPT